MAAESMTRSADSTRPPRLCQPAAFSLLADTSALHHDPDNHHRSPPRDGGEADATYLSGQRV